MELARTRIPPIPDNLLAVETCTTSTRHTLRRWAPPSPSPSLRWKPPLSTGAMAHITAIQQRLSRNRGRRPMRQYPSSWLPQGFALSSASYIRWYLPSRVPRDEPKRARANRKEQARENHQADDNERHTLVFPTGDMSPWDVSSTIQVNFLLHHSMATKPCHRGQESSGVAIILGPAVPWAWEMAGKSLPIKSASNSDFLGRIISVTLCFPNH